MEGNLPVPPNTPSKPGTPVSASYQANTDPVYDEFAAQPRKIASENQPLLGRHLAALGKAEQRLRLSSFSSLLSPEIQHETQVFHATRPSTTDGNCKHKRGSQVFWEDMVDLTEGVETQGSRKIANKIVSAKGTRSSEQERKSSAKKQTEKQKTGEIWTELPQINDSESKKTASVKRTQLPPQPLVRFNSSGDFKAVVDDLYGKTDKRKPSTKPTKWGNIRRMTNVKSQSKTGLCNVGKSNVLTLKQREEKAIKLKEAAVRGWKVIKWYIEHQRLRKYISGGSLGWTVLKQHLNNMADVQSARQDLYKRYGVVPTQQSDGSFKTTNTMRPRKPHLKLVAFKSVKKQTSDKTMIPKPPAFRQTLLK